MLVKTILAILGLVILVGSIVGGIYLCLYVMLYGGIMQAIQNWGTNDSAVVWGIIKAVFFQMGAIPAYLGAMLGLILLGASVK